MTIQGILLINIAALILLFWVLNLIRKAKLYAGYGVMFILLLLSIMVIASIPGTPQLVANLVTLVFPSSGFLLIALSFIAFLFIYVMTQLTIISDRLANLVQKLAIQNAIEDADAIPKTNPQS